MNRKIAMLCLIIVMFILWGCAGESGSAFLPSKPSDLAGYQVRMQQTAQSAGATAIEIGDWIQATRSAEQINAIETQQAIARDTMATATAQGYQQWQATIQANQTQGALSVEATQAVIAAYKTASYQQSMMNMEQIKREQIRTEQQRLVAKAWAIAPFAIIIIASAIALFIVYSMFRYRPIKRDPNGAAPVVVDALGRRVIQPDLMLSPVLQPHTPIPQDLAYQMAMTHQRVQAVRALSAGGRAPNPRAIGPAFNQPQAGQPQDAAQSIIDAEWTELSKWPGGPLPLGMTNQGVLTANNGLAPHLIFAGATGSGKSRYGIRPVISAALADGQQVIALGRSVIDFTVFKDHPGFVVREMEQPEDAIGYLDSVYREFLRRLKAMTERGASVWENWRGAPRLLVVVDELSNLAEDMQPSDRLQLWLRTRMLAREVRKGGITLVIAVQDTTARSLDPIVKRNSTRVVFHVSDSEASRIFLGAPGAESLPDRHFLTNIGGLTEGVAWNPSDQDIQSYLRMHPTRQLPNPSWLTPVLEADNTIPSDIRRIADVIRMYWERGDSKRAMARAAGGEYAGSFASKIDRAIDYLSTTTATGQGEAANNDDLVV